MDARILIAAAAAAVMLSAATAQTAAADSHSPTPPTDTSWQDEVNNPDSSLLGVIDSDRHIKFDIVPVSNC